MTDKERNQAIEALIGWFESQDIMPPDAVLIMSAIIAGQLVRKNRDAEELGKSLALHMTHLAMLVDQWLNHSSKN